ncbi:hypothetical protein [Nocardia amamiensis]|uniref:hypothetical protein n=1 Tax=Nocardia amamiensis TaxID=404578 RepID=UPI00082DF37E|nr:hypothetical protein [Nocardia amamiensis]
MSDKTTSTGQDRPGWHARAGDLLDDNFNLPGIVLCALAVAAMACTLTAAGYGFTGWTAVGAVVTATLWVVGVGALLMEHHREQVIELKYGRHGHAPGGLRPVRYSLEPRRR